mmetsp:Transcript_32398/g.102947  ORF Transcript_32398/g.102947 Transcript_32398/m.102947 type:complete len:213 (-) Transcript_32398:1527-2165(-)
MRSTCCSASCALRSRRFSWAWKAPSRARESDSFRLAVQRYLVAPGARSDRAGTSCSCTCPTRSMSQRRSRPSFTGSSARSQARPWLIYRNFITTFQSRADKRPNFSRIVDCTVSSLRCSMMAPTSTLYQGSVPFAPSWNRGVGLALAPSRFAFAEPFAPFAPFAAMGTGLGERDSPRPLWRCIMGTESLRSASRRWRTSSASTNSLSACTSA